MLDDETNQNRVRQLGVTLTLLALLVTQVLAAVPAYLIPGGNTVGIKLYTRGLVVTAVSDGMAAQAAGLKAGDTILRRMATLSARRRASARTFRRESRSF